MPETRDSIKIFTCPFLLFLEPSLQIGGLFFEKIWWAAIIIPHSGRITGYL